MIIYHGFSNRQIESPPPPSGKLETETLTAKFHFVDLAG